jgi:nicotinate-nucleotide adenylyltransferase
MPLGEQDLTRPITLTTSWMLSPLLPCSRMVPVGVLARPGSGVAARLSVAARAFRVYRVARGEGLGTQAAPAWAFVNLPLHPASSSAIRAQGDWRT